MQRTNHPAQQSIVPVELTPDSTTPVDAEQSQEEVGEDEMDNVDEEEDDDDSPETGTCDSIFTSSPKPESQQENLLHYIYLPIAIELPTDRMEPFDTTGLREIGNLASWTVSTAKPGCGVEALRDEDTNLFWQ